MKKSVLALAMAFGVTGAFAQDLTSKKGEPFLPEAGDWSIGIDAAPFLQYAKTMIGTSNGTDQPTFNFLNGNNVIMGKMFKDEKTAYRAGIRLGNNSTKFSNEVPTFVTTPPTPPTAGLSEDPNKMVVDKGSVTNHFIGLTAGMEMRRGKTRLQGVYGAEIGIWGQNTKEKYEYGNALTQSTTTAQLDADNGAYVTDFDAVNGNDANGNAVASNIITSAPAGYINFDAARVLKRKSAGMFGIGVRGFIGAEYFIFPKISLGGEFGWGIGYAVNTKNKVTMEAEGTDASSGTQVAKELEIKDGVNGGSFLGIDTDNRNSILGPSATLRLNFHF